MCSFGLTWTRTWQSSLGDFMECHVFRVICRASKSFLIRLKNHSLAWCNIDREDVQSSVQQLFQFHCVRICEPWLPSSHHLVEWASAWKTMPCCTHTVQTLRTSSFFLMVSLNFAMQWTSVPTPERLQVAELICWTLFWLTSECLFYIRNGRWKGTTFGLALIPSRTLVCTSSYCIFYVQYAHK